jgi:chemotaxis-related protein WspB
MLFVVFHIGQDRYALESGRVIEVLPLLKLKAVPQAAQGVAGILNLRGKLVPVLDLNQMTLGVPAGRRVSTRVIIADFSAEAGPGKWLGIIAERLTNTVRLDEGAFETPPVGSAGATFLGPVARDASGIIQRITVDKLLTPEAREALFEAAPQVQ